MGYFDISNVLLVTCDNKEQLTVFLKEEKPDLVLFINVERSVKD